MARQRTPEGPPPAPAVQKLRVRYAKRGRLRFTSHRDFSRAFERAIVRARAQRFHPLVCIDDAGRYVGVVRMERLVDSLCRQKS